MKPNFALDFRDDAIALLHRTARGWLLVGEVALDTADLAEALGYLRASALVLSPQGFTTKLILPNSQILYTEVEAAAPDATSRRARVRAALDGLTPYKVDDLVFDIWGQGNRVQVAVIARETLAEAEAFAAQHRFNPVSLVALPPSGKFGGEPFFGPAEGAAAFLPAGETVSRDQDPVNVVGRARDAEAAVKPEDAAAPDTLPVAETSADAPVAAADAASGATDEAETAAAPGPATAGASAPDPAPAAAPPAEKPASTDRQARREARMAERSPATPAKDADKAEAEAPGAPENNAPPQAPAGSAPETETAPEPGPAVAASEHRLTAAMAAVDRPETHSDVAPAPAEAAAPAPAAEAPAAKRPADDDIVPDAPPSIAFASRRRDEAAARRDPPKMPPPKVPVAAAPPRPAPPPVVTAPVTMLRNTGTADPALAARATNVTPLPIPPKPLPAQAKPQAVKGASAKPVGVAAALARSRPTLVTAETVPGDKPGRMPVPRAAALQSVPPGAAAKPAAPTGLGSRAPRAKPRGKPRFLGLILTAALLLCLMLVAIWSSYIISRDDAAPAEPVEAASAPAPADAAPLPAPPAPLEVTAGEAVDLPEPEALATPEVLAAAPEAAAPVEEVAAAEPAAPLPEAPPPPATAPAPPPEGLPAEEAARVAVPGSAAQDEIFLSTSQNAPPAFDAVALPAPVAAPDPAPGAQMPPPPFGTVYQFDADGRIVATPTGVITPEGVWLIAARPPLIPPARPATAAPAPDAAAAPEVPPPTDAAAALPAPEAPAAGAFAPDPAFADSRPRTRPASIAPAPQTDPQQAGDDDASLTTASDPRFAATRPRARTAAVAALAPPQQAAAASLVTLASASGVAVQISPRPAARPQDFSRAVQAAVAAASAATANPPPAPEVRAAAAAPSGAAIAPEEEDEPEVAATAAPRIPTRANVAKQATFVNAINLSKLNLIGIYGTSSSRYALIRTASGRYDKVKVGDRIDGGRVAAITNSELRYQKSGRMLTLAMPRS